MIIVLDCGCEVVHRSGFREIRACAAHAHEGDSQEYRVVWEIELVAGSPREAAQRSLEIQRDPSSTATVFEVYDEFGKRHRVDLGEE